MLKVQTQGLTAKKSKPKDFKSKKSKPANQKSVLSYTNTNKLAKSLYQDKKKEWFKKRKYSIPTIGNNTIDRKKSEPLVIPVR